ncbi:MAG: secondary thiamine-phosphate synthase enzyme YjbQ [Bacteroidales bacterium]
MIQQYEIILPAFPKGFHLITPTITEQVRDWPEKGLMHLFLHHTSAGLTINENADPSVCEDLGSSFDRLVPERQPHYTHVMEGDDDMPAHIKSAITGVSLTIPVTSGRLNLGTWQGIFLCEFRHHGGQRKMTVTIYS